MRSIPRLATAILGLVAALFVAAPVAVASDWTTYKQSGTHAIAWNDTCIDNTDGKATCSGESIDVFVGTIRSSGLPTQKGQQVCYSSYSNTFDSATGEGTAHGSFGCTLGGTTLTVDGLLSATLAPTMIDLIDWECDGVECTESPAGSITVSGAWTGLGPIVSQKGKSKFDDEACLQVNADKTRSRNAVFVGSIDSFGAGIGDGAFTFRTTCSI